MQNKEKTTTTYVLQIAKNCNLTTVRESWKESELIVKKNVRHLQATTYVKKVISGEGISKKYALFLKLLYEWLL